MIFLIFIIVSFFLLKKILLDGFFMYLRAVKAVGKDKVIYIFKPLT